jgi:hypothetical protein
VSALIMVDCGSAGTRPHFLFTPVLRGAPAGYICAECGEAVGVDGDGLSLPHQHPDLLAMLARGDFTAAEEELG